LGRQVSLIQVDTRSDPADALAAMGKTLATSGNIAAILGPDSTSAATLVPLLNQHHLPMMIAAGEAAYDRSSYGYLWRDVPPDPANGEAIALWAKRQGYASVATVFGTDTGSQGDLPGVVAGVKAVGIKLADQENLTPDQPSYRSAVERLLAAKPAAIITESDGPTAATFFGELRQLGSLVPIIGTSGTPSTSYFTPMRGAIGSANFDRYFRAVVVGNPVTNPAVAAFNASVLAVQSKLAKPVTQWENNSFSESGYDAMITLALAMDAAHSTDGTVYNKYITQVTAPGPGKQVVYTYAAGKAALAAGHKIQYIGASGPLLFNQYHNSFGSQAVEEFPANAPAVVVGTITQAQVQALGG
jgi:branched-chain amino acid transport system substrate-binding protein